MRFLTVLMLKPLLEAVVVSAAELYQAHHGLYFVLKHGAKNTFELGSLQSHHRPSIMCL